MLGRSISPLCAACAQPRCQSPRACAIARAQADGTPLRTVWRRASPQQSRGTRPDCRPTSERQQSDHEQRSQWLKTLKAFWMRHLGRTQHELGGAGRVIGGGVAVQTASPRMVHAACCIGCCHPRVWSASKSRPFREHQERVRNLATGCAREAARPSAATRANATR